MYMMKLHLWFQFDVISSYFMNKNPIVFDLLSRRRKKRDEAAVEEEKKEFNSIAISFFFGRKWLHDKAICCFLYSTTCVNLHSLVFYAHSSRLTLIISSQSTLIDICFFLFKSAWKRRLRWEISIDLDLFDVWINNRVNE